MERKAQLSIFIILGLVIVALFAILLFFREDIGAMYAQSGIGKTEALSPQISEIDSFVRGCISDSGYEALYIIGQHGGYFRPPALSTEPGIPYYFAHGKSYMPTKEAIEREISSYVSMKLFFCTRGFDRFDGFEISQGRIITKAAITDNEVIIDVEYPLVIEKGGTSFSLKEFKGARVPVRLGIMHNAASEIIQEQLKDSKNICLSCLVELYQKSGLHISMLDYGEDSVIFIISDKSSIVNKKPYEFVFANKYR